EPEENTSEEVLPPPPPQPKKAFHSWQERQEARRRARLEQLRERHLHAPSATEPEKEVSRVAQESITEHEGLATETLARLLAEQGKKRKAIRMYEQLILLFPEKSRYFAAVIEELKQNS
ncbi:MAG: hypothetical protein KDC54_04570, partial [Lewinella sp.]|nr:hypothetical protein [Lewinella sp.]